MRRPLPKRIGWPVGCLVGLVTVAFGSDSVLEPWDRVPPLVDSLIVSEWKLTKGQGWKTRLAGHARTMAEAYRNPDFGLTGLSEDAWVHHRVQAFLALEHERDFTLAAELTWGEMQGKRGELSPVDEDELDLLQGYVQTRWELPQGELVLRMGRQMLYYGSGRLLAHREGANQRLSHDALRLSWRHAGWQVDALGASPVRVQPGALDNASRFHQTQLWGLYATGPSCFGAGHGVDLYYLGLHWDESSLSLVGNETRHTFGTRWFGQTERWRYNHELILQTGHTGEKGILAGAISLGLGRLFKHVPLSPLLGFKGDLISGGQSGGESHTFHPLFQANNYFNEGGFVSPSNLWNVNPYLVLQLHQTVSLTLGVNFLWRYAEDDAVYGPPFNELGGPAPNGEKYLGTAYNLALSWDPHPAFNVAFGFTHHEAGPSLTAVGGQSVDYLQVAARLEF